MQVLMRSGTEKEKKHAERIAPVRQVAVLLSRPLATRR